MSADPCKITHYQPIGDPYECGKPDYGSRQCTWYKDCPRGGLGGTYQLACRGEESFKRQFYCQDYHVCYECVGVDGCIFSFCGEKTYQAGYREYITEECDAHQNCADCLEYPHRPGDNDAGWPTWPPPWVQ